MPNRTRYGCILFLNNNKKKGNFDPEDSNEFLKQIFKMIFLRKVFYFKIKGINLVKNKI